MLTNEVRIEFGDTDGDTGLYSGRGFQYARAEAARVLRDLRDRGAYIERRESRGAVSFYVEEPAYALPGYRFGGPEHPAIAQAVKDCM